LTVLGTPSKTEWPEGYQLASKIGFKFPNFIKTPLSKLLPTASNEAIDLIEKMLIYDA